jgi:hypothetical protein
MPNVVTNAMFRKIDMIKNSTKNKESKVEEHNNIHAIITIVLTWYEEINNFYTNDPKLRDIVYD